MSETLIKALKNEYFELIKKEKYKTTPDITKRLDEITFQIRELQPPQEIKKKSRKKSPQIQKVE